MSRPTFTRAAQQDLEDIWSFIAQIDRSTADAIEEEIRTEVMRLAHLPSLGHRRRDLTTHDLKFHRVRKNYLSVYQDRDSIEIVRILHGARDVMRELNQPD